MSAKDTDDMDAKGGPSKPSRNRDKDDGLEAIGKSPARDAAESKGADAKGADAKGARPGRESAARAKADDNAGWFDASPKKGRRSAPIAVDEPEDEEEEQMQRSISRRNNKHGDDDDDDIIVIPDMEDDGGVYVCVFAI